MTIRVYCVNVNAFVGVESHIIIYEYRRTYLFCFLLLTQLKLV